jgi:hypothetical protein
MKKLNFLEWNNAVLINSLKKIDLSIILIVLLDFLFYFLSGYAIIFWMQRVQAKVAAFSLPADAIALGYERAQQLVSEMKTFYYLIILSFILLLISIIFLASILKGVIWAKTTNTKISFTLISKFLGLNLIWMGFWFISIFLVVFLVEPRAVPIFMVILIILNLYFTNTLYTLFIKKQGFRIILDAIRLNITKIHLFVLPYTVIFLLAFIILKISNLLDFKYSQILIGLIFVFYAAVVRYYVSSLVLEVKKL